MLSFKNIVPGIATLFCLKHNFYLLSSPDLSVLEINKYAGPLDVGRTIFTGVDGDLISTVFERLKISNILAKKEQSVFLKAIPKITKDDSLLAVFDMLRILTSITISPNFNIIDRAHLHNFERVYPHFAADNFTSSEICVVFAGFLFQSMLLYLISPNQIKVCQMLTLTISFIARPNYHFLTEMKEEY